MNACGKREREITVLEPVMLGAVATLRQIPMFPARRALLV